MEWFSYETADEPASEVSIDVDFDADPDFRAKHPIAVVVTIRGFAADSGGQPNDDQAAALYDLELAVENTLEANDAALVCTISGGGSFVLCGYAADSSAENAMRSVVTPTPFAIDVRSENDAAWSRYEAYILRGEELEEARDADQIDQILGSEEDDNATYEIDFSLEFDTIEGLKASIPAIEAAGFEVHGETEYEDSEPQLWATRVLELDVDVLKAARAQLEQIIAPNGGHYEGWGAALVTEAV